MTPAQIARRFGRVYTAAITDVLDEMGYLRQTLPAHIRPVHPAMRCAGLAFPARGRARRMTAGQAGSAPARDKVLRKFLALLGAATRDSVLVLQANDDRAAHFGELSAEWCRRIGVRGAIIDGATRDAAHIVRRGFPVFTRYLTPQDSVPRWEAVDWGRPVTFGSGRTAVRVEPGDVVVADLDGVVIVPGRIAARVLARCERLVGTENRVRQAVKRGTAPLAAYERYGAF